MVELAVRLVFSLAVVLGMLILLMRLGAKRFSGGRNALVSVVHRQPLSRGSAISVVTVGSRVLVLGITEQQVKLLTELDPEELETAALTPGLETATDEAGDETAADTASPLHAVRRVEAARTATRARSRAESTDGALAGSVLSPQTWKQAFAAATGRQHRHDGGLEAWDASFDRDLGTDALAPHGMDARRTKEAS